MSSKTPIVVGSAAFVALAVFAVSRHVRAIENDLGARTRASLVEVDGRLHVEVSGRDVVLSGSVADERTRDAARAAVASVWGVRRVVDHLQVAVASAPALGRRAPGREGATRRIGAAALPKTQSVARSRSGSTRVTARLAADGAVTLSGQAPSETARAAIVNRARQIFGAERVNDHLGAKDEGEQPGWREAVLAGLDGLHRLARGRLDVTSYRVRVGGIAASADVEQKIASTLRDAAPQGLEVAVDVDTPPRRAASAAPRGAGG